MANMALDRGRVLQDRKQVVIFRATGGESVWMDIVDARRTIARLPAEWSKDPFGGQTYGSPNDADAVEVLRGGVSPLEQQPGW